MKSNCECVKSIEEVVDYIRSLLGGSKLVECDGSYVLKPSNNEELCKAVSAIIEGGASVSPLSRKGTHTEGDFLVDMSDMAGILELDAENMTVKVQAGCKISAIMNAAEAEGLTTGSTARPPESDPTSTEPSRTPSRTSSPWPPTEASWRPDTTTSATTCPDTT